MRPARMTIVRKLAVLFVAVITLPLSTGFAADTSVVASHDEPLVKRDISYVSSPNPRQTFDLHLPAASFQRPVPLIVWIHGGAWKLGSKDWINVGYLVEQGYAIASVDYRFSDEAKFPAQIQDCNTALSFIVAHAADYGVDPKRLIVGGGSAGGHLALLLGMARSEKQFGADPSIHPLAILDFFGPTDLNKFLSDKDTKEGRATADADFTQLLGASPDVQPEPARSASPMSYLNAGNPPVLMLHGDKDDAVPFVQTQRLYMRLTQLGVRNKLIGVRGAGHDGPMFATPEIQIKVIAFLDSILKPRQGTQ